MYEKPSSWLMARAFADGADVCPDGFMRPYCSFLVAPPSWGGERQRARFDFALISDMPYDARHEREFANLMNAINAADVAFVVHNGDFWWDGAAWTEQAAGLLPCSKETVTFGKLVVYVHGDTHIYRVDKPLFGSTSRRSIENFTRVATFGYPDTHWVRAIIDPKDPQVLSFRQEIVKENLVNHGSKSP